MTPEEFNAMRTITEVAHREVGLRVVEQMNKDKYLDKDGWYLSSDGWICHEDIEDFTKTLTYHCAKCGLLKWCCKCQESTG